MNLIKKSTLELTVSSRVYSLIYSLNRKVMASLHALRVVHSNKALWCFLRGQHNSETLYFIQKIFYDKYQFISSTVIKIFEKEIKIINNTLAITLNHNYLNNIEAVGSIFSQFNIRHTIYVSSKCTKKIFPFGLIGLINHHSKSRFYNNKIMLNHLGQLTTKNRKLY